MNWIGGKLQRHAKANANDQKKAQKQYFAKARQRLQHGQPPLSPPALAHFQRSYSGRGLKISSTIPTPRYQPCGNDSLSPHFAQGTRSTYEAHPPSAPADPLERAKRHLLGKDDWAGISVARPLQMIFPRSSEMHRIGRRRQRQKTTARQRVTRDPINRDASQEKKFRSLVPDHTKSLGSGLQNRDYSIRMGSNIHCTQNTGRTEDEDESPSDPMLLDSREDAGQYKSGVVEGAYLERGRYPPQEDGDNNVLQLQTVLDLSSFDDVKERSSSILRQASDSTYPFTVEQPSTVLESETRHGIRQTPIPQRRYQQHSPCFARAGNHCFQENPASSIKAPQGPGRSPDLNPPRFTIDHQVLLERQLKSTTESLLESQSSSQCVPHPPHPPYPPEKNSTFEENFIHPRQQNTWQSIYSSGTSDTEQRSHSTAYGDAPPSKRRRLVDPNQVMRGHVPDSLLGSSARSRPRSRAQRLADSTPVSWRFNQAKRDRNLISSERNGPLQRNVNATNSVGDENEAWMRFVFPRDFGRIQKNFTFSVPTHAPNFLQTHGGSGTHVPRLSPHHTVSELAESRRGIAYNTSFPTNLNTSIFENNEYASSTRQSETDFLSQLSPMEGVLDERLRSISTYANAAQSEPSFVSVPPAYDLVDPQQMAHSSGQRESTTATHRRVLHPLSQAKISPTQAQSHQTSAVSTGPCTPKVKTMSPLWSVTPSRYVESTIDVLSPFLGKCPVAPLPTPAVPPAYQSVDTADELANQRPFERLFSPAMDRWTMTNATSGSVGSPGLRGHLSRRI